MLRRAAAVGACTESLGSESGDCGGGDEMIAQLCAPAAAADEDARVELSPSPSPAEKRRARGLLLLPPAMPRASEALVMRAERHGGRLILTQVRAAERERPGVFRASRDGGRLRLRFASTTAADDAAADDGGETEAPSEDQQAGSGGDKAGGGVVAAAQQHGGGCIGGEFCQVAATAGAAGRRRVEVVGAVMGI
ncbi:hypothetical protein BAE44_0000035 [Dichanthelium oligosanthes]|uniref:FAF domain-containing protein n=1 Tax=Dichanthelium oligosanthes TaxID=888268 RepID=A0A1E5WNG0_9POAL|nr:hypothetical protein BAE44_0000035 [Dichanthelium oligosanthes]